MSKKRCHWLELVGRHWMARDILELQFTRPPDFDFFPGQFLRFSMDGYQRDYTLINAVESRTLDVCVALVKGGRFTRVVTNLSVGDRLAVSGPHGHFIFQDGGHFPVFVATGTGVAPFVAFCRSGLSEGLLLHGAGSLDRLIYADLLCSRIRAYIPCLSRLPEDGHHPATAFPGRVTDYLAKQLVHGTYDFYLCGRRAMIRDATAIIDERFATSRLFVENYG